MRDRTIVGCGCLVAWLLSSVGCSDVAAKADGSAAEEGGAGGRDGVAASPNADGGGVSRDVEGGGNSDGSPCSSGSPPCTGADLNGYVSQYECRRGNSNCDVDVASLSQQACDVTITISDTSWDKIMNNSQATVFCVQAGDHTAKGTLEPGFSGSESKPKVLRYYRASDDGTPPIKQAENERAIVARIRLVDEDHWIIHRLTLDGKGGCGYAVEPVWPWDSVGDHADHNIFDSLLIQNYKGEMFADVGNWNTLQRSVVRNSIGAPEGSTCPTESMCVAVGSGSHFRTVNNEIYNCQKNIAIGSGVHDHVGLIIENNDIYATPDIYSDCKGTYNGTGPCALSESLLNLKAGGSKTDPVRVLHNRIWGARSGDWNLGLTSGGDGEAMGLGGSGDANDPGIQGVPGGDWVLLLNNVVFDSAIGFGTTYPRPDNISLVGNVFWHMDAKNGGHYDPDAPSFFNFYGHLGNGEIYFNTLVDGEEWIEGTLDGGDVRCNAVINARAGNFGGSGFEVTGNGFYAAAPFSNNSSLMDTALSSASESGNQDYCFYRKLVTGPEQVCIPHGKTTRQSPHYAPCTGGVGQRAGLGIDDKVWTWADTLFGL